jgi:hypothetical protein
MYKYNQNGGIMKTTLNIPESLIKEAMKLANRRTKTDTIIIALKEYIRKKQLEKVIDMSGKLDFSDDWERGRHER